MCSLTQTFWMKVCKASELSQAYGNARTAGRSASASDEGMPSRSTCICSHVKTHIRTCAHPSCTSIFRQSADTRKVRRTLRATWSRGLAALNSYAWRCHVACYACFEGNHRIHATSQSVNAKSHGESSPIHVAGLHGLLYFARCCLHTDPIPHEARVGRPSPEVHLPGIPEEASESPAVAPWKRN